MFRLLRNSTTARQATLGSHMNQPRIALFTISSCYIVPGLLPQVLMRLKKLHFWDKLYLEHEMTAKVVGSSAL